jgi:hypothetical protein
MSDWNRGPSGSIQCVSFINAVSLVPLNHSLSLMYSVASPEESETLLADLAHESVFPIQVSSERQNGVASRQ